MDIDLLRLLAGIITAIYFIVNFKQLKSNNSKVFDPSKKKLFPFIIIGIMVPIIFFLFNDHFESIMNVVVYIWFTATIIWLVSFLVTRFVNTSKE